jgi:hypothetical protein
MKAIKYPTRINIRKAADAFLQNPLGLYHEANTDATNPKIRMNQKLQLGNTFPTFGILKITNVAMSIMIEITPEYFLKINHYLWIILPDSPDTV